MMIVDQIWTGNALRNFNYLIACHETGEALAVDPLDHQKCLARAEERGWRISQVLNTHEHGDHTGGNERVISATGAKLLAHENAGGRIGGIDIGLKAGDVVKVGRSVELEAMDTPGHTMCHICLRSISDEPALFSGDTLFNAGAGNCHGGGHPEELYGTFATQLAKLTPNTKIYPGHDYLTNNLQFTMDREPDNTKAASLLAELENTHDPENPIVTTIELEKEINTFFRLQSPSVIARLREANPDLEDNPSPKNGVSQAYVSSETVGRKWLLNNY